MPPVRRFLDWLDAPLHLLLLLCCVVPIALAIVDAGQNLGSTPVLDDWESAALIAIRTADGQFTPADLLRQQAEHRPVFTHLITVLSAGLFDGSPVLALLVSLLAGGAALTLAAVLLHRADVDSTGHSDGRGVALALLPFALLLFNPRLREIWLWPSGVGYALVIGWLLAGLWYVQHAPIRLSSALGAAAWAAGMSFSVGQGWLGWPIFGAALLLRGHRQPAHFGAFAAVGAIALLIYLSGYDFAAVGRTLTGDALGLVSDPNRIVGYVFTFLGGPLVTLHGENIALATFLTLAGTVFMVWNAAALVRAGHGAVVWPWLLLGAFSLGAAIVTALGQAHTFPDPAPAQPLSGRYLPLASPFWIGVAALAVLTLRRWQLTQPGTVEADADLVPDAAPPTPADPRLTGLAYANVIAFIVALGLIVYVARMQPAFAPLVRPTTAACVIEFPQSRNLGCLRGIVPGRVDDVTASQRISELATRGLGPFAAAPPPYTQVIELSRLIRQAVPVRADGAPSRFDTLDYGSGIRGITLIMEAVAQVDFPLTLPDTAAPIVFRSAGIIDRRNLPPDAPLDGVIFRVAVAQGTADPVLLAEVPYDPNVIRVFQLIEADLSPYRGQAIRLILQVGGRQQTIDNTALWLDPVVEVRRPAGESAP